MAAEAYAACLVQDVVSPLLYDDAAVHVFVAQMKRESVHGAVAHIMQHMRKQDTFEHTVAALSRSAFFVGARGDALRRWRLCERLLLAGEARTSAATRALPSFVRLCATPERQTHSK